MAIDTERFTRKDYMQLPEGFPAELIDGMLVKEPSPTRWHQALLGRVHQRLYGLVGPWRVLPAPTDVFLDDWNVLQPDVLVLGEEDEVRSDSPNAALPVLVVEVLSPSTAKRDRDVKAAIYLRSGVREVWLVDPDSESIEVRTASGSRLFTAEEVAESGVVEGFRLSYSELVR